MFQLWSANSKSEIGGGIGRRDRGLSNSALRGAAEGRWRWCLRRMNRMARGFLFGEFGDGAVEVDRAGGVDLVLLGWGDCTTEGRGKCEMRL